MSVPSRASTQVMHIMTTDGFAPVLDLYSLITASTAAGTFFKCLPVTISDSSILRKKKRFLYCGSSPIPEVLRPQQPGEIRSSTEPGMLRAARFTPKPSAPGELKDSEAGELYISCSPDTNCCGKCSRPRLRSSLTVTPKVLCCGDILVIIVI